jgi:hypothetical protein
MTNNIRPESYMPSAARFLLLLGAPLLVTMNAVDVRLTDARKCAAPLAREAQYFVDGRLSNAAAAQSVHESDVLNIMVLCLSPVDHAVIRPGTKTPGLPTVAVWTAHGPSVQLEPLLKQINDAQRAHLAATGAYATTLSALSLDSLPRDVRVSLDATTTRWRAVAEVTRPTSPQCTVFDGALDVPLPGPKGVVRCSDPV